MSLFSFSERFRHWYAYERDCNAKIIQMLQSVPPSARGTALFTRALGKTAHMVAARHMWLFRLGAIPDKPSGSFPTMTLDELPAAFKAVEERWTAYLAGLTDADLQKEFDYSASDGRRYRWPLFELLTQVFGHAWYHRGQIAMLVHDLGGTAVDTDYIFWQRPTALEP